MEFFGDIKFWTLMLSITQVCFMVYGFIILKFNDLSHLERDVKEISESVKAISSMVNQLDKISAVQNQRLNELEKIIN